MFHEVCYPKESDMFRSDMKGFTVFSLIFLTNTNFDDLNQIKLSWFHYLSIITIMERHHLSLEEINRAVGMLQAGVR